MGEIADALKRATKVQDSMRPSAPTSPATLHARSTHACLANPMPDATMPSDTTPATAVLTADQASLDLPNLSTIAATSAQHISIPMDRRPGWERRICAVEPESPTAVRFRHLAIKIRALLEKQDRRSVLVTSALSNEGKTTISINLALAFASIAPDLRIALVDLDLRKGNVSRALDYKPSQGIEGVLRGELSLESIRVTTDFPSLDFYPVFEVETQAHQLLGSSAQSVLKELSTRYDFVICDGPPGLVVPDVSLIAPHVGGCLAVSRSGLTRHSTFKELISLLPASSLLGVFLNDRPRQTNSGNYEYYAAAPEPVVSSEREPSYSVEHSNPSNPSNPSKEAEE